MSIIIKNKKDIRNIKIVSKIASEILIYIKKYIKPGISTEKINLLCHDRIVNYHNAYPASLGYMGFPKSICTSVNDVVCHGIPKSSKILKEGDIINIDVAVVKNKYYSDISKMFFVGTPNKIAFNLCKVTKYCLNKVIKYIKPGIKLNLIGEIIQDYVSSYNYSVVKDYCGHGVGFYLHEDPKVLHYKNNIDIILKSGMIFTIEPMINLGKSDTKISRDGWTVKTKDGSLSAQYEHTILVSDNGCEVLTI